MSEDEYLVPDTGTLMDMYGNRGLDFIVEVGQRKTRPSSVSARPNKEAIRNASMNWCQTQGPLWIFLATER
jgi:hypothetical protein